MKSIYLFSVIGASILLSGCNSVRYETRYTSVGNTKDDLSSSQTICQTLAQNEREMAKMAIELSGRYEKSGGGFWGGVGNSLSKSAKANKVEKLAYKTCMAERGWIEEKVKVVSPSKKDSTNSIKPKDDSNKSVKRSQESTFKNDSRESYEEIISSENVASVLVGDYYGYIRCEGMQSINNSDHVKLSLRQIGSRGTELDAELFTKNLTGSYKRTHSGSFTVKDSGAASLLSLENSFGLMSTGLEPIIGTIPTSSKSFLSGGNVRGGCRYSVNKK